VAPDRICLNYLHVSQEFAPHQKLMEKDVELPDVQERKLIFLSALETLLNGGYVRTGYDHFAKPSDEVAKSMEEKTMHWNSLGYTPGKCLDILGLGVHSYSSLNGIYYTQNVYEEPLYKTMLDSGEFPILRGYELNMDDVIRRDVINALRGYFLVDLREMEKKHNIDDINNYFKKEIADLNKFVKDGLVEMSQDVIYITDQGKEFADNVCKHFDKF